MADLKEIAENLIQGKADKVKGLLRRQLMRERMFRGS